MTTSEKSTTLNRFTGKQRRAMNRAGNVLHVAKTALAVAKNSSDCTEWFNHKNRNVRMLAHVVALKLPNKVTAVANTVANTVAKSEFDLLVERFTAEGKKDPIKSARASLAASAKKRPHNNEIRQVNSLR